MRRAILPALVLAAGALATFAVPPRLATVPAILDDARTAAVQALPDPPASIEELRQRVAAVLERERVPGVGLALVGRDGPIWIGGVGVADLDTRTPVGADTVFRVGSITKSIVALGVMRLVDQRRLDLDRPLREVVPDAGIENEWESVAPVTLAQVLEHTAGLDDMHFNEYFSDDDALPASAALAINRASRVVRWMPGTRFSYANPGYTLAARAIEVATGEPFDRWLRREVIVPLGMRDADFYRTDALAPRLATGYIEPGRAAQFRPIAHRPAGALLASPTDLAQLVVFMLRRSPGIVSPAALARIERTGTLPYPHIDLDYGLGNHGDVSLPARGRGHDGGLPGFASQLRYFPELGVGYVILLNATYSPRAYLDIRDLVFAFLTRGRPLPAPARAAGNGPGADFFGFAAPRHELFGFVDRAVFGWHAVETANGVRLDELLGRSADLVPTADGGYRLPGESGSSVVFARGRTGQPMMIAGLMYAESGSWWLARVRLKALGLALLLLQLAPLMAGIEIVLAARRRREIALVLWPALAGVCLGAVPRLMFAAAMRDELGECNAWTIAVFVVTLAFAASAVAGLVTSFRSLLRRDRPPVISWLVPAATSLAASALALWFLANGIIGLRTWAW
jgi:CubicO group peptidase (beta-lactamase class C family)